MGRQTGLVLVASCATATCLFADFSYQQSTKITGGAMAGMMNAAGAFAKQAREPNISTVAIKGDRMVHLSARQAIITDLEKETITTVHFDQKTYSVMTFEQTKQMMEQATSRMAGARGKAAGDAEKPEVAFHISMKDSGKKRQVAGFDTHEVIMTLEMEGADKESGNRGAMNITSDMWIAPKMAGYEEVRDFHRRMAQKLNWTPGGAMPMMGRPEMAKGMAEIVKQSAKLDGVPVLQVMKMGGSMAGMPAGDGAAAGGGRGRSKPGAAQDDPSAAALSALTSGDSSASLMEMTTELTGFSAAPVDAAKFEVPEGFAQVEPQSMQRRRR